MRESKLYNTLLQLNGHELNKLDRFLQSPYFNQNTAILALFHLIKTEINNTNHSNKTKEQIWSKCFPDSPFQDGRFRKLQSDLLKLIEDYLIQEEFNSHPIQKAKYLLDSLNNKKIEKLQSGALKIAHQLLSNQIYKPATFYFHQYEIEQSIFDLSRAASERSEKSNIEDIAINLDKFYLAEKLRYYCTILNHQHVAALDYKMLFIDEIIQHVELQDYEDVPPIKIYYQIIQTHKSPNDRTQYDILREYIRKYIHHFPEAQKKEILDATFNYCILKSNTGELEWVKELFSIYVEALESKLIFVQGNIDPFSFKNIVTAGLRLKEFDWIEDFIQKYGPLLDEKSRDNAITFNLAQLYFYKKDYPKVIGLLSKVEYDDMTYNLNSKTLLMASYYELVEIEALGSLLDTFRVYLSRNKELPATRRKHYLNTITIVRKLSRIAHGDMAAIAKLQKDVEITQGVVSKNWILEKLAHLQSSLV